MGRDGALAERVALPPAGLSVERAAHHLKDHPETWFLAAKAWAKSADLEAIGRTLSGLHARYPFYLIDEAGDIPPT